MIGNCNDETNLLHKLLLIDRQVVSLCKAFTNNLSPYIQFIKDTSF